MFGRQYSPQRFVTGGFHTTPDTLVEENMARITWEVKTP